MADPKLTKASVKLSITADSGYKADAVYHSNQGAQPLQALADAVDEIARVAEVAGEGQRIIDAATAAVQRVKDWRAANG